ncbi:hypothetical protein BDV96DRAFT_686255 [Lophiotrema nucula]|uniref:Uncharacterized protein n=1 Tax=Lophiotrema nucula TaxID=690887 RepID=A0A6A5ZB72_9PLEO|nr:hypothetical protein BDV96DRAFT_686255 [Lophiotrema nucula]
MSTSNTQNAGDGVPQTPPDDTSVRNSGEQSSSSNKDYLDIYRTTSSEASANRGPVASSLEQFPVPDINVSSDKDDSPNPKPVRETPGQEAEHPHRLSAITECSESSQPPLGGYLGDDLRQHWDGEREIQTTPPRFYPLPPDSPAPAEAGPSSQASQARVRSAIERDGCQSRAGHRDLSPHSTASRGLRLGQAIHTVPQSAPHDAQQRPYVDQQYQTEPFPEFEPQHFEDVFWQSPRSPYDDDVYSPQADDVHAYGGPSPSIPPKSTLRKKANPGKFVSGGERKDSTMPSGEGQMQDDEITFVNSTTKGPEVSVTSEDPASRGTTSIVGEIQQKKHADVFLEGDAPAKKLVKQKTTKTG